MEENFTESEYDFWEFASLPEFTYPILHELLNFVHNYTWKTVKRPHSNFNKFTPSNNIFMKYWEKHY